MTMQLQNKSADWQPRIQRCVAMALVLVLTAIGCDSKPSAPELRDAPVYQNNREGFRFLVPDNWTQAASGILPDGPLDGEVLLTKYRMQTAGQGAQLEVLCFDEAEPGDLHQYHAGPSHGIKEWASVEPPQKVDIHGTTAERFVYKAPREGKEMLKEVVVFRREQRVYSFIGLFWASDDKAREQLRRAVQSIIWR